MQPFTVGNCLSDAFDALARGWRALIVVLAVAAPVAGFALVDRSLWTLALIPVLDVVLATLVTVTVVAVLYDRQISPGRVVLAALRRLPSVTFVMVLIYLVVLAIGFAAALPLAGEQRDAIQRTLTTTGLLLFLLWMLVASMLYTRWFVAIPAAVIEYRSPVAALRRSDRLTRGHRPALFSILALVGTLSVGVLIVLEVRLGHRPDIDAILFAVTMIGAVPLIVLRAAISATAYAQLRAATEAGDPERLAEVFK